uniref:F-box protein GID2 n=1 Tax=Actinidia deliciosa TaxID=3627 RepID=V5QN53_ACTDE|nr:GA signaling F-Box [Actinidia deliciosa]
MKRSIEADGDTADKKMKKIKPEEEGEGDTVAPEGSALVLTDENLLYEVLKHADARTLATAACVSKQWHATARDERLWELICTKHWANVGCGEQQLRSVVLAFGGFRRLHSLYLWPLSKPSSSASSSLPLSTWPCFPPRSPVVPAKSSATVAKTRWGKDEVHLSLSLLSIRYYETMNFSNRGKGH